MTELRGQTVVVIGGSAGIGLETARRARQEGAEVILTGRSHDRLEQAASEVGASGISAFDATDTAALQTFFGGLAAPIEVARAASGRMRPGGSLVFMGGTAALVLELAPVRVNLIAAGSSTPHGRPRCSGNGSRRGATNCGPACRSAVW